MKIALLYDNLGRSTGGIEAYMYHAAEAVLRQGHTPVLLAPRPVNIPPDAAPEGVNVSWLKVAKKCKIPGLDPIKKLSTFSTEIAITCKDVDAFWCRSYLMTLASERIARERPVVFIQATPAPYFTEMYARDFGKNMPLLARIRLSYQIRLMKWMEGSSMAKATSLVYLSKHEKGETSDYYGVDYSSKTRVVPAGVNFDRFKPENRKRNRNNCLKTVSVCRLAGAKNLQCLIHAVAILKSRGIRVESTIVGTGPLKEELSNLIKDLKVEDRVFLAGRRENVEDYYRAADVFVLPSKYEPFGHVYLEALATGLPCIAIKKRPPDIMVAADEIIDHLETGYLIEDNSSELLADALAYLHQNPNLVDLWGKNAYQVSRERYTWERVVKQLIDITTRNSSSMKSEFNN